MKRRSLAAASAALGLMAVASNANAIQMTSQVAALNSPLGVGEVMIQDFDNPILANFTFSADTLTNYTRDGSLGLNPGQSAPPPGDTTNYHTVTNGGSAVLQANNGRYLNSFSFYMGSPDSYNTVQFRVYGTDGILATLSGEAIWGGVDPSEDNGDQSWGYRVFYDFEGAKVTKVEFSATGNSFEFDSLAGNVGVVPEPGAWALMIMGFGGVGAMIRRRKMALA